MNTDPQPCPDLNIMHLNKKTTSTPRTSLAKKLGSILALTININREKNHSDPSPPFQGCFNFIKESKNLESPSPGILFHWECPGGGSAANFFTILLFYKKNRRFKRTTETLDTEMKILPSNKTNLKGQCHENFFKTET